MAKLLPPARSPRTDTGNARCCQHTLSQCIHRAGQPPACVDADSDAFDMLQAPGIHQAVVCVQVVSRTRPGLVLFEAAVPVMGSSHSLGPRQQLPGGIDATPDTFTLPM